MSAMSEKTPLYGVPRPKSNTKATSTANSLAFSSQLSSLLSAKKDATRTAPGRPRPASSKADIFTAHNRNTKKRALKDLQDDGRRSHSQDLGGVDDTVLHRSKRKMEEKARLYAAMKRGDYVPPAGDEKRNLEELGLVDFDRKWAEREATADSKNDDTSSGDDGDGESDYEVVEYTDEFGRQRTGTKAEVAKEERRKRVLAADEPDRFSARPSQPTNIIYGDTIQAAAFNPDEPVAAKIEELARKRDRSLTPPDDLHYDATKEVRSKGVGFYAFSKDNNERKREMEQLERERIETEQSRKEREAKRDKRKAEIEERRKKIREKKGAVQADRFLEGLGGELLAPAGTPDQARDQT